YRVCLFDFLWVLGYMQLVQIVFRLDLWQVIPAEQAAKRFISWLPNIRLERGFGYFDTGAEELAF
ncbi:MAG: hypothetical protein V3T59_04230, partial [Desulfobacterales bacterium]